MVNVLTKKKLTGSVANAGRASGAVGMTERGRRHDGTGICGKNNVEFVGGNLHIFICSSESGRALPSFPSFSV